MELKEKILRVAYELFAEKGYEKTTVNEIIQRAHGSKGGFYHHFKSKEEILETITLKYIEDLHTYYQKIIQEKETPVLEALNHVLLKINQNKLDKVDEWPRMKRIFSFSTNHIILKKMAEHFERETTAIYTCLFSRGMAEGLFYLPAPELLAGVWAREIMVIYRKAREAIYTPPGGEMGKDFEQLLEFYENFFSATLGLESGTIRIKETALAYVTFARKILPQAEEGMK